MVACLLQKAAAPAPHMLSSIKAKAFDRVSVPSESSTLTI